jgi:hypothetical protein
MERGGAARRESKSGSRMRVQTRGDITVGAALAA